MVLGTMAAMTPTGTPISQIPSSARFRRRPTVFMPRTAFATVSEAKQFLVVLSGTLPKPVSSTASFARAAAWAEKAEAIASTMASSFSWGKSARRC